MYSERERERYAYIDSMLRVDSSSKSRSCNRNLAAGPTAFRTPSTSVPLGRRSTPGCPLYMYTYVYTALCVCMSYIYIYIYIYVWVHVCVYNVCMCICVYIYIYIYI